MVYRDQEIITRKEDVWYASYKDGSTHMFNRAVRGRTKREAIRNAKLHIDFFMFDESISMLCTTYGLTNLEVQAVIRNKK